MGQGQQNEPSHLWTVGDISQFEQGIQGQFLRGVRFDRIAVVGRSNVGKSTLLNALMGRRLAQTSAQPGKTRLIHFYNWPDAKKILVDLPGYGFAKASKAEQSAWGKLLPAYFDADGGLAAAILLLDARHGPTEADFDALRFLSSAKIPIYFVMTKSDQLKTQKDRSARRKEVKQSLSESLRMEIGDDLIFWVCAEDHRDLGTKNLREALSREEKS